jgi:hypothetical protein
MSLYIHLANEVALLDGMADLVFSEIGLPDGAGDWRTAMRDPILDGRERARVGGEFTGLAPPSAPP